MENKKDSLGEKPKNKKKAISLYSEFEATRVEFYEIDIKQRTLKSLIERICDVVKFMALPEFTKLEYRNADFVIQHLRTVNNEIHQRRVDERRKNANDTP